uniref:Uncharacterized protein n=1 Tax=Rhizophora mucronata TaxID=61149 RepID=A0A2P2P6J7_RHIMU
MLTSELIHCFYVIFLIWIRISTLKDLFMEPGF